MKRSLAVLYRVVLTLLGGFLLVLSFPHHTPWDMTNLARDVYNHTLVFSARLPFSTARIYLLTPAIGVFIVSFFCLAFVSIPFQILKQAWRSLRSHKAA
ncbi:MAG TPA: hypothetical protein VGA55_08790, partial [Bacteroidota bacterium]